VVKRFCLIFILAGLLAINPAYASSEKIIYHLHGSDPGLMQRAIQNLENLINGMPGQKLDIKLVLQGESIQLLNPYMYSRDLNQRFKQLRNSGVSVEVKEQNFNDNKLFLESDEEPVLLPNIFSRIVDLQKQGYHYITP
jgi:intracellular sulfur oxidation DsrE/DsrF family protein